MKEREQKNKKINIKCSTRSFWKKRGEKKNCWKRILLQRNQNQPQLHAMLTRVSHLGLKFLCTHVVYVYYTASIQNQPYTLKSMSLHQSAFFFFFAITAILRMTPHQQPTLYLHSFFQSAKTSGWQGLSSKIGHETLNGLIKPVYYVWKITASHV